MVATAAATSQHRQCCGKAETEREGEEGVSGRECGVATTTARQQHGGQQQQLDEAKAYAAMRVSECRLSPHPSPAPSPTPPPYVLHIERGSAQRRRHLVGGVNSDCGDSVARWHRQCARPHAKRNKLLRLRPGTLYVSVCLGR